MIAQELTDKLRQAKLIVVMTGAGVSAESGVPTFRDAQTGLWAKYDPTELATPNAFRRNPELVWDWYKMRLGMIEGVQPNPGHYALAEMAQKGPRVALITQNIDSLHQLAGSEDVIELHGNIRRTKCFDHGHRHEGWPDDTAAKPPKCSHCGSLMRPDVVWFGEGLPFSSLETAAHLATDCDVFFSIGTSAVVQPAASLAVRALQAGATVVEINPNDTPLTPHAHFVIQRPSGEFLPQLVRETWGA